ncbi:hypothetical protein BWQ96_07364 [Gracilariopsis chorda]|uniref:Uncharacterized protein n=1 Tax=Gracilariopsis chorda TaxID=448386 RepID=A0A2V3ILJ2_9FLOR|nr:hypothetical protein BWQ96_07364 [Gracilariopsis chorda]|eukprot:PXF42917.1 hypothetical protein BWQ96_07364 [Gracilariopsis chorda]
MVKYVIPVFLVLIAALSFTVTCSPIPRGPSVQIKKKSPATRKGVNLLKSSVHETESSVDPTSGGDGLKWPYSSLADVCEPVIKCMCYRVPPESKTLEMERLCLEYDTIPTNVCDLTTGARLFSEWWFGSNAPEAIHCVEDCIPSMFDKYNWVVTSEQ